MEIGIKHRRFYTIVITIADLLLRGGYGLPGTILWLGLQILAIKDLGKSFKLAIKNASKSIICSFYVYGYIFGILGCYSFWLIYGQTATMQKFISYVYSNETSSSSN